MKATNGKLVAGLASNPEFSKIYVDKKYYNADIHLALSNQIGQYILWDAFDYSDQTNQLKEDSVACGVDHVFTIVDIKGGEKNYYHFATNMLDKSINQIYLNNLDLLKRFIRYFNEAVSQSPDLLKAYKMPFTIDPYTSGFKVDAEITNIEKGSIREQFIQDAPTKHILPLQIATALSKQEIICLQQYVTGKTSREISAVMGLSVRTVENYINNIKQKLHVSTKAELIFRCRSDF